MHGNLHINHVKSVYPLGISREKLQSKSFQEQLHHSFSLSAENKSKISFDLSERFFTNPDRVSKNHNMLMVLGSWVRSYVCLRKTHIKF